MESEAEAVRVEPNFAALGFTGKPKCDYAKRELGWRKRWERADCWRGALPLDQLRGLPDVVINSGSGVYFMWHGPALIYVGQSGHVGNRMWRHENKRRTRTTWLAVNHDTVRRAIEEDHVRRYKPCLNRTSHG
jgi:hypothetical protein